MSFLDEIAARLQTGGVGTIGSTLFMSTKAIIPAGNGPFTTIVETGGSGPTHTQNQAGVVTQRPTAQIAVRAATYPSARATAKLAYTLMDGVYNTLLSGTLYISITVRQEPTDIGLEEGTGRAMVAFNIDAEKYPS